MGLWNPKNMSFPNWPERLTHCFLCLQSKVFEFFLGTLDLSGFDLTPSKGAIFLRRKCVGLNYDFEFFAS